MIKLSSLIRINEQAPAGPMGGAPVPLQTPPGAEQSPAPEVPSTPEPDLDTTPSPEDPNEYDWTKDFRTFEDAKNKAEAAAKKKLLDKMNKQLTGKKITVNASRGYGQPKTDHTIDKVKKVSVEFWYKEWVVIITDQNDKKYFLTPGVNIKIEGGEEIGSSGSEAPSEPEAAPTGEPGAEEEQPNVPAPGPEVGAVGAPGPVPPAEVPPVDQTAQPGTVPPAVPGQQPPPATPTGPVPGPIVEPPKKKKKSLAEKTISAFSIGKDLHFILTEFFKKDIQNNIDLIRHIKSVKSVINEGKQSQVTRYRLEIPVDYVIDKFDSRDLQLAIKEALWSSGNVGQRFSRGSIDVSKVGRMYIMEITQETGWKS